MSKPGKTKGSSMHVFLIHSCTRRNVDVFFMCGLTSRKQRRICLSLMSLLMNFSLKRGRRLYIEFTHFSLGEKKEKKRGRWPYTELTQIKVPWGYRAMANVETSSVGSGFQSQERYEGRESSTVPPGYPGTAVGQDRTGRGVPSSFGSNRGGGTPYFCQGKLPHTSEVHR